MLQLSPTGICVWLKISLCTQHADFVAFLGGPLIAPVVQNQRPEWMWWPVYWSLLISWSCSSWQPQQRLYGSTVLDVETKTLPEASATSIDLSALGRSSWAAGGMNRCPTPLRNVIAFGSMGDTWWHMAILFAVPIPSPLLYFLSKKNYVFPLLLI